MTSTTASAAAPSRIRPRSFEKVVGILVSALLAVAAVPAVASANPASPPAASRIMPLGDSITKGSGSPGTGGYRGFLEDLVVVKKPSFTFVGSQASLSPRSLDRKRHEGHGGYLIANRQGRPGLQQRVHGWLNKTHPDVVLLMVGTNDLRGDASLAKGASGRFKKLVATIQGYKAHPVRVVVSAIPPSSNPTVNARVAKYNAQIRKIALDRQITFVDPLLGPGDLSDGTHPNAGGYQKIATAWNTAL